VSIGAGIAATAASPVAALSASSGWPSSLPGPPALVHQAFDQAQPCHLVGRIDALAEGIAQRLREAVAALPDPQGFLADADVAFQCGNADRPASDGTGNSVN
jgi:hypothetical protein